VSKYVVVIGDSEREECGSIRNHSSTHNHTTSSLNYTASKITVWEFRGYWYYLKFVFALLHTVTIVLKIMEQVVGVVVSLSFFLLLSGPFAQSVRSDPVKGTFGSSNSSLTNN